MLGTGLTSAWSRRPGEGLCSSFSQCCTSQAAPALVASSSTCCCSGAGKPATPPSLAGMALHSPSAGVFWEEKGNNIILFCAEMLFVCCKRNLKAGALRPPPQGTLQQQPMPPAPVFCRAESGLRLTTKKCRCWARDRHQDRHWDGHRDVCIHVSGSGHSKVRALGRADPSPLAAAHLQGTRSREGGREKGRNHCVKATRCYWGEQL